MDPPPHVAPSKSISCRNIDLVEARSHTRTFATRNARSMRSGFYLVEAGLICEKFMT